MTMKARLRRLLGNNSSNNKSRFRKSLSTSVEDLPDAEVSSTSSGIISQDAGEDYSLFGGMGDPYADVRDVLDELALQDRVAHVYTSSATVVHADPTIPSLIAYTVYLSYAVLILIGHIRDFCAMLFGGRFLRQTSRRTTTKSSSSSSYPSDQAHLFAPLLKSWENFYTRRLYSRIQDCFNRPIASNPGANITVLERVSDDGLKSLQLLGKLSSLENDAQRDLYTRGPHYCQAPGGRVARQCINLGSYNYLGFADDWMNTCAHEVKASLVDLPVSTCSSRADFGTTELHRQVEQTVARFLGKEDALCLNMGFNTNATTIPSLMGRGDLIVSDELNHTSIVNGARASGAAIRIFRHNDTNHLESLLRESILLGQPRTRRPWRKIVVIVEGIYSMEGEYCDLRNVVRVSKQYGAYVYLDEAHSIGAMGPTGRGCTEYTGVDTADVDILMGTFTKSFGGMGGYIAASRDTISFLRKQCAGSVSHTSLSPVVCQQVLTSFKIIMGEDGTNLGKQKLQALKDNSNYFRWRLREMGLEVLGRYDSPIMPVMLYNPAKIAAFSRECFKRGLAVVVVGFPAVPLLYSRARFCISAGHSRAELDHALVQLEEIADILNLRYTRSTFG